MQDVRINALLERAKAEGRSSPSGLSWAQFHELLCSHMRSAEGMKPPMPLILAASGESNSVKHQRLAEQLHWAQANGCLAESLQFLNDLEPEQWNQGRAESWSQSNY
jgi:hypothetical protein